MVCLPGQNIHLEGGEKEKKRRKRRYGSKEEEEEDNLEKIGSEEENLEMENVDDVELQRRRSKLNLRKKKI